MLSVPFVFVLVAFIRIPFVFSSEPLPEPSPLLAPSPDLQPSPEPIPSPEFSPSPDPSPVPSSLVPPSSDIPSPSPDVSPSPADVSPVPTSDIPPSPTSDIPPSSDLSPSPTSDLPPSPTSDVPPSPSSDVPPSPSSDVSPSPSSDVPSPSSDVSPSPSSDVPPSPSSGISPSSDITPSPTGISPEPSTPSPSVEPSPSPSPSPDISPAPSNGTTPTPDETSSNISLAISIAALFLGIVWIGLGLYLIRIVFPLLGFVIFYYIAYELAFALIYMKNLLPLWTTFAVAAGGGVLGVFVFSFVIIFFEKITVYVLGLLVGISFGILIFAGTPLSNVGLLLWHQLLIVLGLGIVVGIPFVFYPILMTVGTSFLGAFLIANILDNEWIHTGFSNWLLSLVYNIAGTNAFQHDWRIYLMLGLILLVTVMGTVVQLLHHKKNLADRPDKLIYDENSSLLHEVHV